MSQDRPTDPQRPRGEVVVLPPERDGAAWSRVWVGSSQVKIVKLGPLTGLMLFFAILMLFALVFAFFTGAFLLILPLGLLGAAGAYLSRTFGGRRLR